MLSPAMRTEQATGFNLSPRQTGQGRVSPSSRFSKDFSAARSASSWESKSLAEGISVQTSPKPRQCSHQPCGELKEKRRGSSSSNEMPQSGQFISELRMRNSSGEAWSSFFEPLDLDDFPCGTLSLEGAVVMIRAFAVPLPVSSACLARSRTPVPDPFPIVPIRTSMVCSLKRSRGWKSSTRTISPSTRRVV